MGISMFSLAGCASVAKRPVSDHFDGSKFYNPTLDGPMPGFSDASRMIGEDRAEWPETVENHAVPRLNEALGPNDVSLTFVNHATFLIQFPGVNILTDPVWSERASPFNWIGPKRVRLPGVKLEELPRIDVIVISHNHYDHLDVDTLQQLNERFRPAVIVPIGDKALIESLGVEHVHELDWWESVEVNPETRITLTPAQHASGRGIFSRNQSLWGSYFIQHGRRSVYFCGDAAYSTHFVETRKRLGSPDIALLGIGAYERNPLTECLLAGRALGVTLAERCNCRTQRQRRRARRVEACSSLYWAAC